MGEAKQAVCDVTRMGETKFDILTRRKQTKEIESLSRGNEIINHRKIALFLSPDPYLQLIQTSFRCSVN